MYPPSSFKSPWPPTNSPAVQVSCQKLVAIWPADAGSFRINVERCCSRRVGKTMPTTPLSVLHLRTVHGELTVCRSERRRFPIPVLCHRLDASFLRIYELRSGDEGVDHYRSTLESNIMIIKIIFDPYQNKLHVLIILALSKIKYITRTSNW